MKAHAPYRYRIQVRDRFTYLNDVFEIGLLVNALLQGSKQLGGWLSRDSNPFPGPVSLSDVSITLVGIEPIAVERTWYSSEPQLALISPNAPHSASSDWSRT